MKYRHCICMLFFIAFVGCKKEWLDIKPDNSLTVPSTLDDFQSLLDNISTMNYQPGLSELGSDNYYMSETRLTSATEQTLLQYLWAWDGWGSIENISDWSTPYTAIFQANVALSGLTKIEKNSENTTRWENIYGSALFFRAYALHSLAQVFCKNYNSTTLTDLGLPLRLEANITEKNPRSTIGQTYAQIINDLIAAKDLVPFSSLYKNRPTKTAVYAMLARTYLSMEQYEKALLYSDSALQLNSSLIDYNSNYVNSSAPISFPTTFDTNIEMIFFAQTGNPTPLTQTNATVDSILYQSYNENDLRKKLFFRNNAGRIVWAGNYRGTATNNFSGLAVDELFLINAECLARIGDKELAIQLLNTLVQKRWDNTVPYPQITAQDNEDALKKILQERRKELCFRGLRWSDLRRLNKDDRFSTIITRIYNNRTYTLSKDDKKYVWPIPNSEIFYSGIPQNR